MRKCNKSWRRLRLLSQVSCQGMQRFVSPVRSVRADVKRVVRARRRVHMKQRSLSFVLHEMLIPPFSIFDQSCNSVNAAWSFLCWIWNDINSESWCIDDDDVNEALFYLFYFSYSVFNHWLAGLVRGCVVLDVSHFDGGVAVNKRSGAVNKRVEVSCF